MNIHKWLTVTDPGHPKADSDGEYAQCAECGLIASYYDEPPYTECTPGAYVDKHLAFNQ